MLPHLTPMIAALSLALTAGSIPGWSKLSAMIGHHCTSAQGHGSGQRQQPARASTPRHTAPDVQIISFGP